MKLPGLRHLLLFGTLVAGVTSAAEILAEKDGFQLLRPEAPVTAPSAAPADGESSLDTLLLKDDKGHQWPVVLREGRIDAKFDEATKFLVILNREDRANFEILILDLATRNTLVFDSNRVVAKLREAMDEIHVDTALGPFEPDSKSFEVEADHAEVVARTGSGQHQGRMKISIPLPSCISKDAAVSEPKMEILSVQ